MAPTTREVVIEKKEGTREDRLFECLTLVAVAKDCLSKLTLRELAQSENLIKLILVDLENAYQGLHRLYTEELQTRSVRRELANADEDDEWRWNN